MRGPASFHSGHDGPNIWMHPPNRKEGRGYARAKYRLNRDYSALRFTAKLNATRSGKVIRDPIIFTIFADGRQVWSSGHVRQKSAELIDEIEIRGVRELELRVESLGDATGAHARWDNVMLMR